jgi:hypothetical protein
MVTTYMVESTESADGIDSPTVNSRRIAIRREIEWFREREVRKYTRNPVGEFSKLDMTCPGPARLVAV